jgi:hypothetical protein
MKAEIYADYVPADRNAKNWLTKISVQKSAEKMMFYKGLSSATKGFYNYERSPSVTYMILPLWNSCSPHHTTKAVTEQNVRVDKHT